MTQGDVPVRILARCGIIRRIADTRVGRDRENLLDAQLGVVPKLHGIRQISVAGGYPSVARSSVGVVFGLAGRRQAVEDG
jgi:hypothetical protein